MGISVMRQQVLNRISVDFNEMLSQDEILLSQEDTAIDLAGRTVALYQGLKLGIYSDDGYEFDDGTPAVLIADGTVCANEHTGWGSRVKWILKIDERGPRHAVREAAD